MPLKYISDKEELLDTRISQNLDTSYLRLLDSTGGTCSQLWKVWAQAANWNFFMCLHSKPEAAETAGCRYPHLSTSLIPLEFTFNSHVGRDTGKGNQKCVEKTSWDVLFTWSEIPDVSQTSPEQGIIMSRAGCVGLACSIFFFELFLHISLNLCAFGR